jgi:hypothetical protein
MASVTGSTAVREGDHFYVEVREGEPQHLGTESAFDEDAACELPADGTALSLEQCDACGGTTYVLRGRAVVCTRDPDDEDQPAGVECGAEYRVRTGHADDLVW